MGIITDEMRKILKPVFHFWRWSLILFISFLALAWGYCNYGEKDSTISSIWEWFDPASAIMSFFITIAILYNQARQRWENGLEKRLSIDFVYDEKVIAKIENAYLAGESDIRAWSQQLGKQIMGDMKMDMNWDEEKPNICLDNKEFVKAYKVKIYLAVNPLASDKENKDFNNFKNVHSRYRHSVVEFSENFPKVIWRRTGFDPVN